MGASGTGQRHLERRGTGYFRRRPAWVNPIDDFALVLSLRTHVPADARILARRLTQMRDQVFAAVAETNPRPGGGVPLLPRPSLA